VPTNTSKIELVVYDIIGNVIKQYPLQQGNNKIELMGHELDYGVYFYSMVSKGRKIATKRMMHLR